MHGVACAFWITRHPGFDVRRCEAGSDATESWNRIQPTVEHVAGCHTSHRFEWDQAFLATFRPTRLEQHVVAAVRIGGDELDGFLASQTEELLQSEGDFHIGILDAPEDIRVAAAGFADVRDKGAFLDAVEGIVARHNVLLVDLSLPTSAGSPGGSSSCRWIGSCVVSASQGLRHAWSATRWLPDAGSRERATRWRTASVDVPGPVVWSDSRRGCDGRRP